MEHSTSREKVVYQGSRDSVGDVVRSGSSPNSIAVEDRSHSNDVSNAPLRNITGMKWALVVLSILSSTFLFSLDNTIVADVQPTIVRDFDSLDKLTWLPVAFLLGAAGTNLFWYSRPFSSPRRDHCRSNEDYRGQCYAQFNAKFVYILCVVLFETGSAICGGAQNMDTLIVGRVICGLGGAGMYTGVMVLLSLTTSESERPMYFGLTGLTWGLGTMLGPVLGGVFVDSRATWRWVSNSSESVC